MVLSKVDTTGEREALSRHLPTYLDHNSASATKHRTNTSQKPSNSIDSPMPFR